MKKIGIILTLSTLTCSTIIGTSTYLATSNNVDQIQQSKKLETDVVTRDKTPIDYFGQTPILTQKTGPIISYGSKISALDWYGSTLWSFDFNDSQNHQYYPGGNPANHPNYTNRAFINWALDSKNDTLWILTNSTNNPAKPQKVIALNSLNGSVKESFDLDAKPDNQFRYYYQIQVLSDGNVQIYAQGNEYWGLNILYDIKNKTQKFSDAKTGDKDKVIKEKMKKLQPQANGEIRMLYLIPIKTNVNVAVFSDFNSSHVSGKGTGDLFLQLVDNSLNEIKVDSNSQWNNLIHIPVNIDDKQGNKTNNFSKTIYTTLDGKVYFTAWNKFFVFYPDSDGYGGIRFAEQSLPENKRVLSYTMDVNENVYIKYWEDKHIYKLTITGNSTKTNFTFDTYYDIGSSNIPYIKNNADNFVLYNVTGYSGSIMLLSSRVIYEGKDINDNTDSEKDPNYENYGVAAAIVPNPNNNLSGDTKGLLNTDQSFLKSSDFTIDDSILKSKLPSEITRNDIKLLNDGFFTSNKELENGVLKYPPFTLSNINDQNGSFTVTAYLDQIPWFTNTLPNDAIPKKIEKVYNKDSATKITSKVSWKQQTDLSYDFKNMLPSEVQVSDIEDFDPFQVSFNSRTVIDASGKQQYPKKTYSIGTRDDSKGEITINVKYDYMPVSNEVNTVQTYSANFKYNIFKSSQQSHLYFAGSDKEAEVNTNNAIDIKTVPQLKALSQSNLLPSSFNGKDKNSFLQFINTNKSEGHPISRMTFNVQANDNEGSLIITATSKGKKYTQKYIGFNQVVNYNFQFNEKNSIDNKLFSTMLPSSVNEGDIIDNLVTYSGFNSSDFKVTLFPNDSEGKLNVKIELNRDYASNLGNNYGFKDYVIQKEFSGFMTTDQYNNKYNIMFRENGDEGLVEIKKQMLSTIKNAIEQSQEIVVGNNKYKDLNDLVEKVFIKSKGTNIPTGWSKNSGITTNLAINNQAGTMNISISIDKSLLGDYGSNLNYVISYSGFANGNVVETEENLSFVDQNLLKTIVTDVKNMKPSEMAKWLEKKENLLKIIFSYTGQYVDKFSSNEYELITDTNDNYGTISITIKFKGELNNKESLTEYSIQYNLYK